MALLAEKNWDRHVVNAEEIARGDSFQEIRDRIIALADPRPYHEAVDIGAGTGLLALELAPRTRHVWAIDIAPSMCEYLRAKSASAGLDNVDVAAASAVSLPLVDGIADIVVSNYCFHHLSDADKVRALEEVRRVLRPGGRVVIGDMMFTASVVAGKRDRRLIWQKVRALLARGPAGALRLAKNGFRYVTLRWEKPVPPEWWQRELARAGFAEVQLTVFGHEGGIATAVRPETPPLPAAADPARVEHPA